MVDYIALCAYTAINCFVSKTNSVMFLQKVGQAGDCAFDGKLVICHTVGIHVCNEIRYFTIGPLQKYK